MRYLWRIGVALLVLGIGSFLLPLVGMQFKFIDIFGPGSQTIVGILLAVVGAVLVVVSFVTRSRAR